jgi:hypothetical protein
MNPSIKFLTLFSIAYGILGIGLLYSGIERMHGKRLPPFNDGLYIATWSFPSPPVEPIKFFDGRFTRIAVWSATAAVFAGTVWSIFADRRRILGFSILLLLSSCFFFIGTWTWIFGLLN